MKTVYNFGPVFMIWSLCELEEYVLSSDIRKSARTILALSSFKLKKTDQLRLLLLLTDQLRLLLLLTDQLRLLLLLQLEKV